MTQFWHRYNLETNRYWGSTRTKDDDHCCGYTEIDPPVVDDHYTQIQVWTGTEWVIEDKEPGT
jgi:hypothetical protein